MTSEKFVALLVYRFNLFLSACSAMHLSAWNLSKLNCVHSDIGHLFNGPKVNKWTASSTDAFWMISIAICWVNFHVIYYCSKSCCMKQAWHSTKLHQLDHNIHKLAGTQTVVLAMGLHGRRPMTQIFHCYHWWFLVLSRSVWRVKIWQDFLRGSGCKCRLSVVRVKDQNTQSFVIY
jgi:hypothetical protein